MLLQKIAAAIKVGLYHLKNVKKIVVISHTHFSTHVYLHTQYTQRDNGYVHTETDISASRDKRGFRVGMIVGEGPFHGQKVFRGCIKKVPSKWLHFVIRGIITKGHGLDFF